MKYHSISKKYNFVNFCILLSLATYLQKYGLIYLLFYIWRYQNDLRVRMNYHHKNLKKSLHHSHYVFHKQVHTLFSSKLCHSLQIIYIFLFYYIKK